MEPGVAAHLGAVLLHPVALLLQFLQPLLVLAPDAPLLLRQQRPVGPHNAGFRGVIQFVYLAPVSNLYTMLLSSLIFCTGNALK